MMRIKLSDILIDPAIQIRDGNDEDTVQRYMESFDSLPPVDVFDTDEGWLLADGFHRSAAGERLGLAEIEVVVHEGTRADAAEFAALANTRHGKPLKRAERDAAIRRLRTLRGWTHERLAAQMGVSQQTVSVVLRADEVRSKTTFTTSSNDLSTHHLSAIKSAPEELWVPLVDVARDEQWTPDATAHAVKVVKAPGLAPEDREALLTGAASPRDFAADGRRVREEPTFGSVKEGVVREVESDAGARMLKRLIYEIETASRWPMGDLLLGLTALDRRQMRERLPGVIAWLEALNAAVERDRSRLEAMR